MQENVAKIKSGVEESMIDHFILQTSMGSQPKITAAGQVKRCDKDFIYVEINEEDFDLLRNYCKTKYFDIAFNINRVGYQIQHRALDYLHEHNLHPILIDNPEYDLCQDYRGSSVEFSTSGKLYESLNDEQKTAVKFIAKSDNFLPYLLFGPAG